MYEYLKKHSALGNKRAIANNVDMNIEVSKSDLDRIHADSIRVPGTDMYVGGLGVYHELHCLVRNPMNLSMLFLLNNIIETYSSIYVAGLLSCKCHRRGQTTQPIAYWYLSSHLCRTIR
jgi:hypothetical protein